MWLCGVCGCVVYVQQHTCATTLQPQPLMYPPLFPPLYSPPFIFPPLYLGHAGKHLQHSTGHSLPHIVFIGEQQVHICEVIIIETTPVG